MASETLRFGDFRPSVATLRATYDAFSDRLFEDGKAYFAQLPEYYGQEAVAEMFEDYDPKDYVAAPPETMIEIEVDQVTRTYHDAAEAFGRMQADSWTAATLTSKSTSFMIGPGEAWGEATKRLTIHVERDGYQTVEYPTQAGVAAIMGPMSEAFKEHRLVLARRTSKWGRFWTTTNKFLKHPIVVGIVLAVVGFVLGRIS